MTSHWKEAGYFITPRGIQKNQVGDYKRICQIYSPANSMASVSKYWKGGGINETRWLQTMLKVDYSMLLTPSCLVLNNQSLQEYQNTVKLIVKC